MACDEQIRILLKNAQAGAGGNGVEKTGAVVGAAKRELGGMSPQALRVNVPAPIPINLIKSLRVIFWFMLLLWFIRLASQYILFL